MSLQDFVAVSLVVLFLTTNWLTYVYLAHKKEIQNIELQVEPNL